MGRKLKDYSGQIHGCWKVIERDKNPKSKSHETFWICECLNCGKISSVRKGDLDKNPKSCNNCKGKDRRKYEIGDKYGLLTIIGNAPCKNNKTYVKVQCDCGSKPFEVRLEHLKGQSHARTISCGCAKRSSGELKIKNILMNKNLSFKEQYRIKDKNNNVMIFDFMIMKENNIIALIEYDGEQHYRPVEYFGGENKFKIQQIRDERKDIYCKENNIVLIRIPYYDYEKINDEYILNKLKSVI